MDEEPRSKPHSNQLLAGVQTQFPSEAKVRSGKDMGNSSMLHIWLPETMMGGNMLSETLLKKRSEGEKKRLKTCGNANTSVQ